MLPATTKPLLVSLLLAAVLLAGCTGGGKGGPTAPPLGEVEDVDATSTTGGIHGFVVDQKITPIKGATVTVTPGDKTTTTDDGGAFVISGLEPGTYFVKASHPLYDTQQQSTEVVAGEKDPKDLKFQLVRTILATPYIDVLKFDGYIVCSQDFSGTLFSEECGEGAGVPCGVPVAGCQRVGGQDNNQVQYDFFPSADQPKSLVVELSWEPTIGTATTGALWTIVETNFVCDPTCHGDNVMNDGDGQFGNCATNPSYIREDDHVQTLNLTAATKISTFTWACGKGGTVPYDLELNQRFEEFVTMSYYLPLPEGWSFVKGDTNPF